MASTIKVDNIQNQCGGAVVTKCGATTTISGSVVKANNIQAADGGNLINQCGTTITLGASGDTINLASGASQTGFGRTGTVDWDTTAKTAGFTAVSGTGYFVNTTSGAITMNLPATPSAGDIVSIKDYAYTFGTNNFIVDGNGSPIGGTAGTIPVTYSTNGTSKTFVYVDGTKGWLVTNESTDTSQEANAQFVTATGGTITCCGDYKIHTFTSPGTFTVTCAGNPSGSDTVDYLVLAGGGGGGARTAFDTAGAGGGAAGGYRFSNGTASGCYAAGPAPLGASASPVSVTGYPISVGGGGAGGGPSNAQGTKGSNSIFSSITSTGGGGGAQNQGGAAPGGSGGGGSYCSSGGAGNTPPTSPPQGNPGGNGTVPSGAGGGGGGSGGSGVCASTTGNGGPGLSSSITTSPVTRAGGGGGGGGPGRPTGGTGQATGGNGGNTNANSGSNASTANYGSGGGGGAGGNPAQGYVSPGGNGSSGIVVIRYKYQ